MLGVFRTIARGPSTATVLVLGDSGTGKEWWPRHPVARTSSRRPFVAVNCAAIQTTSSKRAVRPREGSFHGAIATREGASSGHGGTLFLDESPI